MLQSLTIAFEGDCLRVQVASESAGPLVLAVLKPDSASAGCAMTEAVKLAVEDLLAVGARFLIFSWRLFPALSRQLPIEESIMYAMIITGEVGCLPLRPRISSRLGWLDGGMPGTKLRFSCQPRNFNDLCSQIHSVFS
jgi:hypothetical protein